MANTYTQITIHAVIIVKHRNNFITKAWRDNLHSYISGIITTAGGKSFAVGGWLDHVHVLFSLPLTTSISDFMRVVKSNSSKWVNEQNFINQKFEWQVGYGAFSFARSQRDIVIKYILNQEEHHKSKTFKEEYLKMLNDYEIEYDEKYLFDFFE